MWFEDFEERLLLELIESFCVFITDYHSAGTITTLKGFVKDNGKLLKPVTGEKCAPRKSYVSFTK